MVGIEDVRAGFSRRTAPVRTREDAPKTAAVAAVLRPSASGAEVLLIERAKSPRDPWSGHMAFPGGRREASDRDLLDTATRETREEVSLNLAQDGELLGQLDDVPAIARGRQTGLVIRPYVFAVGEHRPLRPNGREVASIVWAPIGALRSGAGSTTTTIAHEGRSFELPAWNVEGRVVWGLTHRMLTMLLDLL